MTYADAIQFLYGRQMFGANFGLETTRKLAARAGDPQAQLRFIHVAGTNGKGSTCAMLESIYRTAGLRVGLFTSPHLVSFRERIQVNRRLISEADVARLADELAAALQNFPAGQDPTMFEVITVLALRYFAEQKCDLVIWETGLGGRLDATNIVTPLASVITNIALDHQQWLGDTLEKIAAEKSGIIKPRVPAVTAETRPGTLAVIASAAERNHAPLTVVTREQVAETPLPPLPGEHQKVNAALARTTATILRPQIPVSDSQLRAGLADTRWPGRLQVIARGAQTFLLDGAHNAAGAETLRAALSQDFPAREPVLILGILGDKDWRGMCELLAPLAKRLMLVPVGSERTAPPAELAEVCRETNPTASVSCSHTLAEALRAASEAPFVVIAGSLYLVGEALALLDPAFAGGADERKLNDWKTTSASTATPKAD